MKFGNPHQMQEWWLQARLGKKNPPQCYQKWQQIVARGLLSPMLSPKMCTATSPFPQNKKFAVGSRKYIIHVTDHFCTQMILEHHIGYESPRRRTTNRQSQIYITSNTTLSTVKVPAPLRSLTVLTLTLHQSLGHGALLTRKRRKNL